MQALVSAFKEQWEKFIEKLGALGKTIGTVQKHYDELSTTRTKALERPMDKISELKLEEPPALNDDSDH